MPSPGSAGAPPREVEVRHRRAGRLQPAARGRRAARLALLSTAVLGCGSPQNALDPRGPGAARIEELWWVLLGVAVVVSVGVTLLLLWATHRSRQRSLGAAVGQVNGRALVWIAAGIVTPAVVLALTVHSYRVGASVYTPLSSRWRSSATSSGGRSATLRTASRRPTSSTSRPGARSACCSAPRT
jgi:uncharacterized membrane protein